MLRRNETSQGQIRMPSPRRAVLAAAALLAAWALPAQAQMGPPGPPTIGTVAAQKRAVTESSEFTGRIQAAARVDVVARVTAFIEARTFTEGGEVQEGELLFRLDPATFQAEVAAREANVAQATALLRNATLTLSRAQALIGSGAGRASAVDDARTQQASLTAQLQAAGAQLRAAQINLGYTEVTAPISGRVGRASLSAGNVVTPASGPLVTIVSQDPMYVTFPVPLRQALELRNRYAERGGFAALRVRVRLPDGRIYAQAGTLDYADPSVAPSTDSLTLRATIPNPVRPGVRPGEPANRDLLDGAFVTVFLEGIEPIRALAIPRAAVLSDPQGSFVYVIDAEKKTQQRRITLAPSPPGLAIVTAGLQEGETIAVDGLQRLRPNIQGNPVPAQPPAGAPPAGAPPAAPRG
jgi:membrane fusion protein (multidrug efflux system)